MPVSRTIPVGVTFDPETQDLTVERPEILLDDGQNVRWRFEGLPDGWRPGLRFDGPPLYGPFTEIRRTAGDVWGIGNTGIQGLAGYLAVVVDPQDRSFHSAPVAINNVSAARLGALELTVSVDLASNSFFVVPFEAQLLPGGVVMWEFVNLPAGHAPAIRFALTEGTRRAWLGPFESLSRVGTKILGSGQTALGRFAYEVEILSAQDGQATRLETLQSGDPIVDSEGEPPLPP